MTRFLKSAIERVMARFARPAQTTERRGPSRKIKGVSTVEYALILVAVVGIVGGAVAVLSTEFDDVFKELKDEIDPDAITTEADKADGA